MPSFNREKKIKELESVRTIRLRLPRTAGFGCGESASRGSKISYQWIHREQQRQRLADAPRRAQHRNLPRVHTHAPTPPPPTAHVGDSRCATAATNARGGGPRVPVLRCVCPGHCCAGLASARRLPQRPHPSPRFTHTHTHTQTNKYTERERDASPRADISDRSFAPLSLPLSLSLSFFF